MHWSITSDSTEVSEFRSSMLWLLLYLMDAHHVHIISFKKIFHNWWFSMDAVGATLKNMELGLLHTRALLISHHGLFDYHHYMQPASENNGCIAIAVSLGFSQSRRSRIAYIHGDVWPCMTSILFYGPTVGSGLYKVSIESLQAVG